MQSLLRQRALKAMFLLIEQPHQPHSGSGHNTAHKNHLHTSKTTLLNTATSMPAYDYARLYVTEQEQRDHRDTYGYIQPSVDTVTINEKVWKKRKQTAEEVTRCNGHGGNKSTRGGRLCCAIYEMHEEISGIWWLWNLLRDVFDGGLREVVRLEDLSNLSFEKMRVFGNKVRRLLCLSLVRSASKVNIGQLQSTELTLQSLLLNIHQFPSK